MIEPFIEGTWFLWENPQEIARIALFDVGPIMAYWLLSAYGAECEGRELDSEESYAKRAYMTALHLECRLAEYPNKPKFDGHIEIRDAVDLALPLFLSGAEAALALCAVTALNRGEIPSETSRAALRKFCAERARLWRLAGKTGPPRASAQEDPQ